LAICSGIVLSKEFPCPNERAKTHFFFIKPARDCMVGDLMNVLEAGAAQCN
jgi:hypothetical protein